MKASILLYVIRPASLKHAWMPAEIGAAAGQGKRITSIFIRDLHEEKATAFIAKLQ